MNATTTVRTYYFPEELWNIIKEYYGFIPDFPVRLGEVYERYAKHKKQVLCIPKIILKRELGIFNYQSWYNRSAKDKKIDYPEDRISLFYKNWLITRGKEIRDAYKKMDVPFNFTHTDIKVGDKMKLYVNGYSIVFKPDKDNVVPREDYSVAAVSVKEKEKGMVSFNPVYISGRDSYVPVIVKSVSALKVKLEYYKYNVVSNLQERDTWGVTQIIKYSADWSEPRGKIVCSWANRENLLHRNSKVEVDNPEASFYMHLG